MRAAGLLRRAISPAERRASQEGTRRSSAPIAAAALTQTPQAGPRARDRYVPLPVSSFRQLASVEEQEAEDDDDRPLNVGMPIEPPAPVPARNLQRGRVHVCTVAESFHRKSLEALLLTLSTPQLTGWTERKSFEAVATAAALSDSLPGPAGPSGRASVSGSGGTSGAHVIAYPEVLYASLPVESEVGEPAVAHTFLFDYGERDARATELHAAFRRNHRSTLQAVSNALLAQVSLFRGA